MNDLEHQLSNLDPELAKRIRDSAARAGLQSHDPAARMIAEMWVAVSALETERELLSRDMAALGRRVRDYYWFLVALMTLSTFDLLAVLAL